MMIMLIKAYPEQVIRHQFAKSKQKSAPQETQSYQTEKKSIFFSRENTSGIWYKKFSDAHEKLLKTISNPSYCDMVIKTIQLINISYLIRLSVLKFIVFKC